MIIGIKAMSKCDIVKHELRITSCELRVTSYKVEA